MDFSACTVEELCRFVVAHPERRGIGVVLVLSAHPVDWDKIERRCRKEGPDSHGAFVELRRRVARD